MRFAQGPENAKTTSQILDGAWLYKSDLLPVTAKSVQACISGIRHQIEPIASQPRVLKSNPGRPGKNARKAPGYFIDVGQRLSQEIKDEFKLGICKPHIFAFKSQ